MNWRVLRIVALVAALFLVNVAARLVSRLAYGEDPVAQDRVGWLGWGGIALVMAVAAWWWGRLRPQGAVAADLGISAGAAGLLYVVVGPFVSEPPRFVDGLGGAIIDLTVYLGIAGLGALVGMLTLIALGRDYQSRALRRYAESRSHRPRRHVRRS